MAMGVRAFLFILVLLVPVPGSAPAQEILSRAPVIVDIGEPLSFVEFEQAYGDNKEIPRTDEDVLALARRLFHDPEQEALLEVRQEGLELCGSYDLQLLLTALKNPAISEAARETVRRTVDREDAVPFKEVIRKHFRFYYRDNHPDPKYNVTLRDVEAAAEILNQLWYKYSQNFRTPLHYVSTLPPVGRPMIDILVRPLPGSVGGMTSPDSPVIQLAPWGMKDECFRKEICAHELFHRVQYSYGWHGESSTRWLLEGSATWSQKYAYPREHAYMRWMNRGLTTPNVDLTTRAYDACHLYVYLAERAGWSAIRQLWANYKEHGPMESLDLVTARRLGLNFEEFLTQWMKANYVKETANAPPRYEYEEDDEPGLNCGREYGPLRHVDKNWMKPVTRFTITVNAGGTLQAFGAHYYVFPLDPSVTEFTFKLKGSESGVFRYYVLGTKNNLGVAAYNGAGSSFSIHKKLAENEWDQVAVVVMALMFGGDYTLVYDGNLPVAFPDPVLRSIVRKAIGKPTGPILKSDLVRLTSIDDWGADGKISNLSGLEYCGNLQSLRLPNHLIADVTPLARLRKVVQLNLTRNQVANLRPLRFLEELESLELNDNQVIDVRPIQWCKKLIVLDLGQNRIQSVETLENLSDLTYLRLDRNRIANISPLSGLTKLKELYLSGNLIQSLEPLSMLTGLLSLHVADNRVSTAAGLQSLSNLVVLSLARNPVADISDLAFLHDIRNANLESTEVDDIQPLVDNPGLGMNDYVWLRNTGLSHNCDPAKGDIKDCKDVQTLKNRGVYVGW